MPNQINQDFAAFRLAVEEAPPGTYAAETLVRQAIGEAVDGLIETFRELGFPVCNSDGAHNVEATILAWVRATGKGELESCIGLGRLDHDARSAAVYRLARDQRALEGFRRPI